MRAIPFTIFSVFVGALIAICAWPAFVASGGLISHWQGEGSILDAIKHLPQQNLIDEFWFGYEKSKAVAIGLGVLATLDYFTLSRHRLTWIIAGLSLPIACIALMFTFYKDPAPLLPTFVMTGVCLFILYRFADLIRRLFSR